ncbi:hypothetical protein M413DRAFT_31679 [Hebeloma cylindrosporum]|uniref:CCAAT-binding factor domain-containing protein n=1 Tax=Hebeloma cylindrosporum TaxID=76867 RepID=A0A0C3BWI8_HEBCY|nr:hypothetical protein M413DRAFT_31679 [Hebeloma cylindrosporum h7]
MLAIIITNGKLERPGGGQMAKVVKAWIWDRLQIYVDYLGGLLQDEGKFLRKRKSGTPKSDGDPSRMVGFWMGMFRGLFHDTWFSAHDDMIVTFFIETSFSISPPDRAFPKFYTSACNLARFVHQEALAIIIHSRLPPAAIVMVILFTYGKVKRHPPLMVMIDRLFETEINRRIKREAALAVGSTGKVFLDGEVQEAVDGDEEGSLACMTQRDFVGEFWAF